MKTAIKILSFGMLLFLTGCVTLYKPNAIHSPMLKEKGELSTSASLGLSGCGLYNLQAAYAISNHTGVMMDGMIHNRHINNTYSPSEKLNIFFGECGAGYFTSFGNQKNELFQCYSGAGYGTTTDKINNDNQPDPEVNANFFNIYFQPGLAFTSKYFKVAFDIRANYVRLFDIHAYLYDKFEWWNTDLKFYSDTTLDFVNLEPAITIKVGNGKLNGILQLGVIIPTINASNYIEVNNVSTYLDPVFKFSVGINYTFGRK
jgi:hypothetical protein